MRNKRLFKELANGETVSVDETFQ